MFRVSAAHRCAMHPQMTQCLSSTSGWRGRKGKISCCPTVCNASGGKVKRSPFKARSRSVYSHTCYACCQGFLPCLFLPFQSIHLHFLQNLSQFLLCWLWLTHGSCVGPQNKIGDPSRCRFPCWVPAEYEQAKKNNNNMTCGMMTCEMNDLEIEWSLCSALM